MIKRLLIAIMIAMPVFGFAQSKFGVVNSNNFIETMPEFKEVQAQLEASSKKFEDEFTKLREEFQNRYTELQKLDESTPQSIRDRRLQELQELDSKIQQFRETASADLQRQQAQLMTPIQEKVMKAIQTVGEEGNFTFIFENMVPIYIGKDVVDVTSLVKSKLGL